MATQPLDFSDLGAKPVAQPSPNGRPDSPLDFSDLGGKRVSAGSTGSARGTAPTATISARPSGVMPWLEDLQGDIRYGTGATLPGRLLQKMGAPGLYSGVPESVGEMMGGPAIGPVNVAHAAGAMVAPSSTLKQRVRGFNEAVRGAAQTATPALAIAAPEALPQLVPIWHGAAGRSARRGRARRRSGYS
jgi:hypothetical protein